MPACSCHLDFLSSSPLRTPPMTSTRTSCSLTFQLAALDTAELITLFWFRAFLGRKSYACSCYLSAPLLSCALVCLLRSMPLLLSGKGFIYSCCCPINPPRQWLHRSVRDRAPFSLLLWPRRERIWKTISTCLAAERGWTNWHPKKSHAHARCSQFNWEPSCFFNSSCSG